MGTGFAALIVMIGVALLGGLSFLIYRDIKRPRVRVASPDSRPESAEAEAAFRPVPDPPPVPEEPEEILKGDTERRKLSTSRILLAACDLSEPEGVDDLIADIRLTRLHIQNLTVRKREEEAIISLLDAAEKARTKRETLEKELSRENP